VRIPASTTNHLPLTVHQTGHHTRIHNRVLRTTNSPPITTRNPLTRSATTHPNPHTRSATTPQPKINIILLSSPTIPKLIQINSVVIQQLILMYILDLTALTTLAEEHAFQRYLPCCVAPKYSRWTECFGLTY
jgi:hypothetical protein